MSAARSRMTAGGVEPELAGDGVGVGSVPISLAPELNGDGAAQTLKRRGNLSRGRTWILIGADCIAIAVAIALTYGIAEAIAPPALIAPTWLVVTLAVLALPDLDRDLHRLQPLRAPGRAASRWRPSTRSATSSTRCSPAR